MLSCGYFLLCFFAHPGFTQGTAEGQNPEATEEIKQSEKDTSLHTYYQKYLSPFLNTSQTKSGDKLSVGGVPGPTSSGGLLSNDFLSVNTGKGQSGSTPGAKKEVGGRTYFSLSRVDSIGLSEMNKSFPQLYKKEYIAELALGIKLSPLLDLSFGKVQKFERPEGSPWEARDDGWRIRLKKDF